MNKRKREGKKRKEEGEGVGSPHPLEIGRVTLILGWDGRNWNVVLIVNLIGRLFISVSFGTGISVIIKIIVYLWEVKKSSYRK